MHPSPPSVEGSGVIDNVILPRNPRRLFQVENCHSGCVTLIHRARLQGVTQFIFPRQPSMASLIVAEIICMGLLLFKTQPYFPSLPHQVFSLPRMDMI